MKLSELYKSYQDNDGGGDKGTAHSYIDIYQKELDRTENICLLEIGVYEGHSVAMWQQYFQDSEIIGVDIDLSRIKYKLERAIKADATKPIPSLLDKQFDYIIDDGSHYLHEQIEAFDALWPQVKIGGKYFIEDIIGDEELRVIQARLEGQSIPHRIYDCRKVKGRSDDILIVADKVK